MWTLLPGYLPGRLRDSARGVCSKEPAPLLIALPPGLSVLVPASAQPDFQDDTNPSSSPAIALIAGYILAYLFAFLAWVGRGLVQAKRGIVNDAA